MSTWCRVRAEGSTRRWQCPYHYQTTWQTCSAEHSYQGLILLASADDNRVEDMMLRIYVDFNTMMTDKGERVLINTHVHKDLLSCLRAGVPPILHDETLEVMAVVDYDADEGRWWARPDWSTSRDLPYSPAASAG